MFEHTNAAASGAGAPPPLPPSSPPAPAPVCGPQFCAPYALQLTVQKKAFSFSGGDFLVTDVNGNLVFKVDGRAYSRRSKRVLQDAAGIPVSSFQRKIFSLHGRWNAYRGNRLDDGNLLFTVKRSSYFQLKTSLDVYLASDQQQPCFKVKGDYFERSCTVHWGNQTIAEMKRKFGVANVLLGRDTFVVTVYPGIDYALIVILIVIMDEFHGNKQNN